MTDAEIGVCVRLETALEATLAARDMALAMSDCEALPLILDADRALSLALGSLRGLCPQGRGWNREPGE